MAPRQPAKEQGYLSPSSTRQPGPDYINQDLADAVRDSVQIKSPASSQRSDHRQDQGLLDDDLPRNHTQGILLNTNNKPSSRSPALPSLDPLVPRRTPSPNTAGNPAYHHQQYDAFPPSPDDDLDQMASVSAGQPALPSSRMAQLQNPFADDEIEPPVGRVRPPGAKDYAYEQDGTVQPRRAKFTRAHTGAASPGSAFHLLGSPESNGKVRTRRSLSTDSYGVDPNVQELTAGQKKKLADKKGSRHADVIDTWDPTGMGSASESSAGPYDAAAPSRNANAPNTKAPMRAFGKEAKPAAPPPPQRGPSSISLSAPAPPAKDSPKAEQPERRRPGRAIPGRRPGGGGLTGQYSTSMPTDGGYFPNEEDEPQDEAAILRMEKQKEREAKRMALKAAWGIDTPEPFEDYGRSPQENTIDITEELYSPESVSAPLPGGRPMRSPGSRFGPMSPPIQEEGGAPSPGSETAPSSYPRGGVVTATNVPPGGIKRTKSLMQKIKTMRENGNSPMRGKSGERSYSPHQREPSPMPSDGASEAASDHAPSPSTRSNGLPTPITEKEKQRYPHLYGGKANGRAPSPKLSGPPSVTFVDSPGAQSPVGVAPALGELDFSSPAKEVNNDHIPAPLDFSEQQRQVPTNPSIQIVESPSSKARALRALQKEASLGKSSSASASVPASTPQSGPGLRRKPSANAPPVAPVLPEWDDYWTRQGKKGSASGDSSLLDDGGQVKETTQLKRKTSMVKKLRDKMGGK
ncbi:hypothetical protein I350_01355 [Cryptococcus amylolentus CBS 6273]|uniref:Uncharacterized protein n=1 Tax=Cryptococcus amylolentus CBS 6273 TaxID=1296118 RepID=A0A1E3KCD3_9TREE|nr:hypothetical protein I350_01355 [Cryptococcus amylolentus CBS 6273]